MPAIPPSDLDPNLARILDYLREHSGRYSLSALREQLLQNGYDAAAVDWALAVFQGPPTSPEPRQTAWPWVLTIAAFNAVLAIVLTIRIGGSPSQQQYWIFGPASLVFLICLGELFIAFLMLIPRDTRPWIGVLLRGIGLFAGVAVVALGGLCFMGQ